MSLFPSKVTVCRLPPATSLEMNCPTSIFQGPLSQWAIPEKKNQTKNKTLGFNGESVDEDMEFPGVSNANSMMWNFQGLIRNEKNGISLGDQDKIMWSFQGSWFLVRFRSKGCS